MSDLYDRLGMPESAYQKLRMRVDLFDQTIYLTRYEDGRTASCYEVSPDGLANAFRDLPLTTGLLPRETLFYVREGEVERLGVFLPPGKRRLVVRRTGGDLETFEVPLPALVLCGQGSTYWIFAVKQRPGEDDRLYHAPLPNVYSNGAICMGSVEVPPCAAGTMRRAIKALLESPFNHHLVNRKSRRQPDDVTVLWAELQERRARKWPADDLIATEYTMAYLMRAKMVGRR